MREQSQEIPAGGLYHRGDGCFRVCCYHGRSGTFAIVRTKCDHGKAIHLTVYPDEGIFSGYIHNP